MKHLSLLVLVASTFAFAQPALQEVTCESNEVKIQVQVDVLESNPPQSSISVDFGNGDTSGFSAFTQYLTIETNPSIDQWTWVSHNNAQRLVVESRDGRSGTGMYYIGRRRGIELTCTLQ